LIREHDQALPRQVSKSRLHPEKAHPAPAGSQPRVYVRASQQPVTEGKLMTSKTLWDVQREGLIVGYYPAVLKSMFETSADISANTSTCVA